MNRFAAEALGTFALVFAGTGAIVVDGLSGGAIGHPGVALCFGAVVMVMIYAVGDVSGAHLNPAVTLGFWLARRLPGAEVVPYALSVATGAKEKGITAGIAIGATVGLAALFGGPISGASMNPACSLGPARVGGELEALWIYLAAPVAGAGLAVLACRCSRGADCCALGTPASQSG